MKYAVILFTLIFFSGAVSAQKPTKNPPVKTTKTPPKSVGSEKEEFEKAASETNAAERIKALQKFVENFPKSAEKNRSLELIVVARTSLAEEKLTSNEIKDGLEFIKTAFNDAPKPVSDKLFAETFLPIPTKLFWTYKQREAAIEIAKMIEEKIGGNSRQVIGLTTFYLGTENASEAKRLAQKAVALDRNSSAAYQMLGLASRMNFELDESVNAYTKALELEAESVTVKRSLAEMKRAVGKADEAAALYREILSKDANDAAAQTGLILSLFDAEKKQDAETEMAKALEVNPNNLSLLVGAAYSYAARDDGAKAVELAQKALAIERRFVWAHIALARGFLAQKRPLDAERALLNAKQYGNFPTLDYEIAAARMQAGFYREAAEALKKSFSVKDDNLLQTRLGNRVAREAKSFIELLADERRASIFEPLAADNPENAEKLKSLLDFAQKLDSARDKTSEAEIVEAVNKFVGTTVAGGDDEMKTYRQLFAASSLLQEKKALPKVLELTQAVVGNLDAALDAPVASTAVMADELYESRTIAITRGEYIIVPDVSRQILSKILRGRVEEITGWTHYQQNNAGEAVVRLKRALSVFPEKSAWWRSSMWRLGSALEADGKSTEALDAYIKSYTSSATPDAAKHIIIEALYQKVNGSTDGLEQKIGAKPAFAAATSTTVFTSRPQQNETVAETKEKPTIEPTPETQIKAGETKIEEKKVEETKADEPEKIEETPKSDEIKVEPSATPNEVKVEPSPSPMNDVKTETTTEPPAETKTKPETEIKQAETVQNVDTEKKSATTAAAVAAPKPLFDPIVITIPKPETTKKKDDSPTTNEKSIEKSQTDETKPKPEDTPAMKNDVSENVASGEMRERKIEEKKSESKETLPCPIIASQDGVSLLNGGGSLGILIGFREEGDLKQITAASSSPKDVEVALDPEVGENSGRAFYIIKSISTNKGAFTVTFEAPCGKKEVLVKVR